VTEDGSAAVLVTLIGVGDPDEQRVSYTRHDEGVEMSQKQGQGKAGQGDESLGTVEEPFSPSEPVGHKGRPLDSGEDGTGTIAEHISEKKPAKAKDDDKAKAKDGGDSA
jgi:hypothetical protein